MSDRTIVVRWLRRIARSASIALLALATAAPGCMHFGTAGNRNHDTLEESPAPATGEVWPPPPPPPPPPPAPPPPSPPPRHMQIGAGHAIPSFPWPPPKPTSRAAMDRSLLARGNRATLGTVARHLQAALERVGYSEHSFYAVPGGFALATRLEQITPNGTPKVDPQRWSTALPAQPVFSLGDYLRALFVAPQGDYRVIVFIVTNQAFGTSARGATNAQAQAWLSGGMDRLPRTLQAVPFDADFEASALVYQFRKTGHADPPVALESSAVSASSQLERSGIVAALRR